MRSTATFLASCALLGIQFGSAAAGPCTTEIESVAKILASKDAGSGPSAGATATSPGQHPPTSAMSQADPSTTASTSAAQSNRSQHPPTAEMNTAATGLNPSPGAAGKAPQEHPPTAAMNQATQGGAASPQNVQRQTSGNPTAAQQSQGSGASTRGSDKTAATAELERARSFDRAGQEAQCMDAVRQAKQHAGT